MEPPDQGNKRDLYNGFGDTLARAFEFAAVLAIFGAGGWGLDRWLDTSPVFTIVTVIVATVGLFARLWYGYEAAMQAEEARAPWRAGPGRGQSR